MKPLVLVAALVAIVHGRPEAGYSYSRPSDTYGAPGGGIGIGSGGFINGGIGGIASGGGGGGGLHTDIGVAGGHIGGGGLTGAGVGPSGGGFIGGGDFTSGGGGFIGGGGGHIGGGGGHIGGGGDLIGGGGGLIGGLLGGGGGLVGGGGGLIGGGGFGGGGIGGGTTLVQKHIYVHVPPPEPEEVVHHRPIPVAPAQKHYKIIFIKAPSAPSPTAPVIPLQPQNEEKTLVYVLVKKPDDVPDIHIPTPAPTQPSKPEVYFIKYKTQKDVTGAGSGIAGGVIGGGDHGGIGSGDHVGLSGPGDQGSIGIGAHSSSSATSISGGSDLSTSYGPPGHGGGPY